MQIEPEIRQMTAAIQKTGVNVNQIARRVNVTGRPMMQYQAVNLQTGKSILHQFEGLHKHWDTPILKRPVKFIHRS